MSEIDNILNKNEKLLWKGKPVFAPYFISFVIASFIILTAFYFAMAMSIYLVIILSDIINRALYYYGILSLYVIILFSLMIWKVLDYRVTEYAITNKRIITQSGVIGRDFKIMDFDKFNNAIVNVGFLDKIFKTGTIKIRGNIQFNFSNIRKPYEVFKYFKKTSFDVKTDIYFPNKYRPKENPGYKTKYKP